MQIGTKKNKTHFLFSSETSVTTSQVWSLVWALQLTTTKNRLYLSWMELLMELSESLLFVLSFSKVPFLSDGFSVGEEQQRFLKWLH